MDERRLIHALTRAMEECTTSAKSVDRNCTSPFFVIKGPFLLHKLNLRLIYYESVAGGRKCSVTDRLDHLCSSQRMLMSTVVDSTARVHQLHSWFGLSKFFILGCVPEEGVTGNLLGQIAGEHVEKAISCLALASDHLGHRYALFVSGTPAQGHFTEYRGLVPGETSSSHLSSYACELDMLRTNGVFTTASLWDFLLSQICRGYVPHPGACNESVRLLYKRNLWLGGWAPDSYSERKLFSMWGPIEDPVTSLSLSVLFANASRGALCEQKSRLDPTDAPYWALMAADSDEIRNSCRLSGSLSFLIDCLETLKSSSELNLKAASLSHSTGEIDLLSVPRCLKDLLLEIFDPLSVSIDPKASCYKLKACPPSSLWTYLAVAVSSCRDLRQALAMWRLFCNQLQFHWHNCLAVPRVPKSNPQFRFCNAMQMLQLLNRCISGRGEAGWGQSRGAPSDNQGAGEDAPPDLDLDDLELELHDNDSTGSINDKIGGQSEVSIPDLPSDMDSDAPSSSGRGSASDNEMSDSGLDEFVDALSEISDTHQHPEREDVAADEEDISRLRLLSGAKLTVPATQDPPPVTEKMFMDAQAVMSHLGSSGPSAGVVRAKLQGGTLLSDMQAFKAANPGAILEDFVRWHSPRDWLVEMDSRRPSLSGLHFQEVDREDADDYFRANRRQWSSGETGCLSARMSDESGMWSHLWKVAEPMPVSQQPPLFDVIKEAEIVMHHFENADMTDIFEQLTLAYIVHALDILNHCPAVEAAGMSDQLEALSAFVYPRSGSINIEALRMFCVRLRDLEFSAALALSLNTKTPHCGRLVKELCDNPGAFVQIDIEERGAVSRSICGVSAGSRFMGKPSEKEITLVCGCQQAGEKNGFVFPSRLYATLDTESDFVRMGLALTLSLRPR